VIKDGYKEVLFEEIARHFFGVGMRDVEPANEEEMETFLFLLDTKSEYAVDYINSWLKLRGLDNMPEESLNSMEEYVKMRMSKTE
jgi:hypothetical protein